MNRVQVLLTVFAVLLLLTVAPSRPTYLLNLSESMQRGIYEISSPEVISLNDVVVIELPRALRELSETRSWLSPTAPLLKRVGALQGASICSLNDKFSLNGKDLGFAVRRDDLGLSIPHFEGCRTVAPNRFLALGDNPTRSFDSRYFGDIALTLVRAKAKLIYKF